MKKELFHIQMVNSMMENFLMNNTMAKVNSHGKMEIYISVNGKIIKEMDLVY